MTPSLSCTQHPGERSARQSGRSNRLSASYNNKEPGTTIDPEKSRHLGVHWMRKVLRPSFVCVRSVFADSFDNGRFAISRIALMHCACIPQLFIRWSLVLSTCRAFGAPRQRSNCVVFFPHAVQDAFDFSHCPGRRGTDKGKSFMTACPFARAARRPDAVQRRPALGESHCPQNPVANSLVEQKLGG